MCRPKDTCDGQGHTEFREKVVRKDSTKDQIWPSIESKKDSSVSDRAENGWLQFLWESHHATNPCVVRFRRDPRVFLGGYRAGGAGTIFRFGQHDGLGQPPRLAVLDEEGKKFGIVFPCRS